MRLTRLMALGLTVALMGEPLHAADSRSSSSSSSSYSKPSTSSNSTPRSTGSYGYSKPSESYTKPQSPSATTARKTPPAQSQGGTASGYSKPTTTQAGVTAPRSAADTVIAKGQSKAALTQFDADQKAYKAPPVGAPSTTQSAKQSPVWQQYGGTRWRSADDYYASRRQAETQLPPQVHNYYTSPSVTAGPSAYGGYSSGFLTGALLGMAGTAAYDSWAYSHRHEPDYMRWHSDMERRAADDSELRAKLSTLDSKVAELEAQKAPVTDKLPEGVDPALIVAPQTVLLATAKSGINWWVWAPVTLLILGIGFVVLCVVISRRRQRLV